MGAHGLTNVSTGQPSGVTGAYSAGSAVGAGFAIPLAAGAPGGIVYTLNVFDGGSAAASLDLLLFAAPFTSANDKAAFGLTTADWGNFLGAIPVTGSWMSAGANALRCTVNNPGVVTIVRNSGLAVPPNVTVLRA